MLFNKSGLFSSIVLSASILAAPIAAYADLVIVNNTKEDSTSIINGGVCSTTLKEIGVTKAGKRNVVPKAIIDGACWFHPTNCTADIYMNPPPAPGQKNTCSGIPIATVILNTTTGIVSANPNKKIAYPQYKITFTKNSFDLSIDPI